MSSDLEPWAGDYVVAHRRLELRADGEFKYDAGKCTPVGSSLEFPDAFGGRYRMDGSWIVLEPTDLGPLEKCAGISLRLYASELQGRRYLFDERYLRAIAHEVRRGQPGERFSPWHIVGEPDEVTANPKEWLPAPFAQWATMPSPSGRIVAIGPVEQLTRRGPLGQVEGVESFVMLTLDFGQRHGAFENMPVCVEGHPGRSWLQAVAEDTSTLRWTEPMTDEGAPQVGTAVDSLCR